MHSQGTPHMTFPSLAVCKESLVRKPGTCTFSGRLSLPYINLDLRDITNHDKALHNHGCIKPV